MAVDYNKISAVYDEVRRADVDLLNCFLREVDLADPAARALDVGCGTGNHTDLLQRLTAAQIFGVEPSAGMLARARQKNSAVTFKQGHAAAIPFEAGRFDFVFMTDVIHHVPDLAAMFAELNRVLKPGGKVCLVTQSHRQIERRPIVAFFPDTATVDKARYPDIDRIIAGAARCGLACLKLETQGEDEPLALDGNYLELVRKKGYSMLHLISDEAYARGLQQLEAKLAAGDNVARAAGMTLVWLVKPQFVGTEPPLIRLEPVGYVESAATEKVDEQWGAVQSRIVLREEYRGGLVGLAEFSHALVLTFLHQAKFDPARHLQRHPQGRADLPLVGIFSQRAKDRPNPIGVTAVKILAVDENSVTVQGLDAIHGTPVLDVKPYFAQYDRVENPVVPAWVNILMENYF